MGDQIVSYFSNENSLNINVNYIKEDIPLGTLGAITKIKKFTKKFILITNSDVLTTLDYESFFLDFIENNADMSVVTIPYVVDVPYGVMETSNNHIISFKEKPKHTYYCNAGIYLIKKDLVSLIPKNKFYNTTDLMELVINSGKKLISYPTEAYWLDIGSHEDYKKAQIDIERLDL